MSSVRKRALSKLLFCFFISLCGSELVLAQDICRDQFVSCVEQTGDSFSCRSVYTNCLVKGGTDLVSEQQALQQTDTNIESLIFNPQIVQLAGGLSSIRLSLSNPTSHPIQIGTTTYPIRCADGSSDRAVFFMDFSLDAGVENRSVGADQIACIGAGGAIAIDTNSAEIEGLTSTASILKYEFPCTDGQARWITLTYQPVEKIYRWENSEKILGVLNRDFIYEDQFAEMACGTVPPVSSPELKKAIDDISKWLGAPSSGTQIIYRNAGPGVRG